MSYLIKIVIILLLPVPTVLAACIDGEGQSITYTVVGDHTTTITFAFNSNGSDAQCGQYANGDYWISPAIGETDVTITGITSTGSGLVSADADIVMESMGLLDGTNTYGNYNVTENIISSLPLTYSVGTSILAAVQKDEASHGDCGTSAIVGECVDTYATLTILITHLSDSTNALRPNLSGAKMFLGWTDFDLSSWPQKSYIPARTAAEIEVIRQRWSHNTELIGLKTTAQEDGYSEGGRAFRADNLVNDYGGGMAATLTNDILALCSSENTLAEIKPALAAILTFGLDIYTGIFNSNSEYDRFWGTGATQSVGKMQAPYLLATLLNDDTYKTVLRGEVGHLTEYDETHGPHELGQIQHGTDAHPIWGNNRYPGSVLNALTYWGALLKQQAFDTATRTGETPGNRTSSDPYGYIDGPPGKPLTAYAPMTYGVQRGLIALMAIVPGYRETVNYDRLYNYVTRLDSYGKETLNDPCVTPDTREPETCEPYPNGNETCLYYGITWGDDGSGNCITSATPPYTEVGRFKNFDGDPVEASYTSYYAEQNWAAIMSEWENQSHRFQISLSSGAITGQ